MLQELVQRIISIATRAVPENFEYPGTKKEGAFLRFINMNDEYTIHKQEDLDNVVFQAEGGTFLGTNLYKKILKPLVYDILETQKILPRPLLILTITDGNPSEDKDTFREKIVECIRNLDAYKYPRQGKYYLF